MKITEQIKRPQMVLVVDDQEINRDALEVILEDDYDVIFAENGQEALDQVRAHIKELSLVLLDLMMPVMTGFEVLEAFKDDEELKKIPIIVLTADKSAELEALQLGAADFITKPFDMPEIILARVGRIIELSEGRQLISAAEHDPLTGLYSRNFFHEYVNRLFEYRSETHMDAVVLNIEQFHNINALHGRDFGDEVLKTIAGEITEFLSETFGIAGRMDADDFEIYCKSQQDYEAVLKRLQERVNSISDKVNIHLRMGVMPWQEDVKPVMLFDGANAACNMARGNFNEPLMIYDENLHEKELLNQRLLNDLRAAEEEKQFRVFYQPKYDIQCDPPRLASAEALIRWQHPELGMISPGQFVPLLEGNGLIGVVDKFVWREAAEQVAVWRKKYGIALPVSVNISRSDLSDPDVSLRLEKLVKDADLAFNDLKLEITESAYTDNANEVLRIIDDLRGRGFEIEMDDFGSGYSSLNMLSDMPIDVLKMDMVFIRNIETSETDRKLVNLVLNIAKYLGVPVVAEGVETEGQLNILKKEGCQLVQGYYFSKPVPPEEFEKLIEKELAVKRD